MRTSTVNRWKMRNRWNRMRLDWISTELTHIAYRSKYPTWRNYHQWNVARKYLIIFYFFFIFVLSFFFAFNAWFAGILPSFSYRWNVSERFIERGLRRSQLIHVFRFHFGISCGFEAALTFREIRSKNFYVSFVSRQNNEMICCACGWWSLRKWQSANEFSHWWTTYDRIGLAIRNVRSKW